MTIRYKATMKNFSDGQNLTVWEESGKIDHSNVPVKQILADLVFRECVYAGSSYELQDISRDGVNKALVLIDQYLCLYITWEYTEV